MIPRNPSQSTKKSYIFDESQSRAVASPIPQGARNSFRGGKSRFCQGIRGSSPFLSGTFKGPSRSNNRDQISKKKFSPFLFPTRIEALVAAGTS